MIKLPKLILASNSPRRAEILTSVGWNFTKDAADINEIKLEGESPENYVQRLAWEKALAVARKYENALVLGADTTVVVNQQVLGKPVDLEDARNMLKMLSGTWHDVLTGVALIRTSQFKVQELQTGLQKTGVKFAELKAEEIEFLVAEGEPLDKAGAYAVQAQAALFIEKIEGDYWNVVGLPINLVYQLFTKLKAGDFLK